MRYDYPLPICKYCSWTDYGIEPYHDGYPNVPCEGIECAEAAQMMYEETGEKWEDE